MMRDVAEAEGTSDGQSSRRGVTNADSTSLSWDYVPRWLFILIPLLGAVVHLLFGLLFYSLDQPTLALLDVAAVASFIVTIGVVLKGRPYVGMWIWMGSAIPHTALLSVALGIGSGLNVWFVGFLFVPFLIFRGHHNQMIIAVALIVVAALVGLGCSYVWDPWIELDTVAAEGLFGLNLLAVMVVMVLLSFASVSFSRRQIVQLQREVTEARRLGQYTLGEKIGAGGMGQVYRATHALLRRPAAIKLIREGEVSETSMRRFEKEVQLTSELTHPNTIAIYDYGHTPAGVFYYVMEYLDGLDLHALVQRHGPQPPERVVHILGQACGALEEAHSRGLVHRDIKPANIVLCRRGDVPDVVKVLDFGLVKDLRSPNETRKNAIAGTPAYLSPEAIEDPDTVGPQSDLYALGAVGYFLITGEHLFDKKTLAALCAAHLNERPVAPTQRLGSSVPEVLEELVMSCLEKDPAHRPKSARALRHALDLADLDKPWAEDEARAWWTKHEASEPVSVAKEAPADPPDVTVDVRGRTARAGRGRA